MRQLGGSVLAGAAAVLCLTAQLGRAEEFLVRQGVSRYTICISAQASPSEKRGAAELQHFLEQMSGARLPIVTDAQPPRGRLILVGQSRALDHRKPGITFQELGAEGFALKSAGRDLVIAGGRERGTMYGVYAFLEKLGCRWFTHDVSRIPRLASIPLPKLNETQKPSFEYREPYFTEALDKDWAARNRQNGSFMHLDESTGGNMAYYPFVHSFYEMVPPKKYFAEHPEYFSLIDGKRRSEHGQLCLTNPDMLRTAVSAVEGWIAAHPEAAIYSVSQNDWEGWCECDRCRRVEQEEGGAHSGPLLRFVNALAEQIGQKHPGKLIDTLAYWYTEDPPAHVRPRPNVRIRLCPIGVCEAHPYEKCPRNAYFMRNLKAWSNITSQLYIWHYNTNFTHYLMPFPDFEEFAADLPMYQRHGVVGVFLEGAYPRGGGGEAAELRSYVMAKMLWDVKSDVNQAVNEFLEGVYGPAARPLRAYYDLLHRQVRERHLYIFMDPERLYGEDFLRQATLLFDEAERAAPDDAIRRRVRKARLPIEYLKLASAKTFRVREDGVFAPDDLDGLKRQFSTFVERAGSFGIEAIREGMDLKADQEQFARNMRPYAVRTLENGRLRVDIAPELGGRVIRMLLKPAGTDVLYHAAPSQPSYPNSGGLALSPWPDLHERHPYQVAWKAEESAAGEVVLAGRAANGLLLRRTISLAPEAAGLTLRTEAVNEGQEPFDLQLQGVAGFDPGMMDTPDVSLEFRARDRSEVKKVFMLPGEQPEASYSFRDAGLPDGLWTVVNRRAGIVIRNRFDPAQAERCLLSWTQARDSRVFQEVWSKPRRLAPGESMKLDLAFTVEKMN
ncbi:MAG TPA: DUF4838 domain-containing protein [Bryobacteraceae bacterium]|nr:DUF4838 domain-containing protein [Bryobacteraceae bacterium]